MKASTAWPRSLGAEDAVETFERLAIRRRLSLYAVPADDGVGLGVSAPQPGLPGRLRAGEGYAERFSARARARRALGVASASKIQAMMAPPPLCSGAPSFATMSYGSRRRGPTSGPRTSASIPPAAR